MSKSLSALDNADRALGLADHGASAAESAEPTPGPWELIDRLGRLAIRATPSVTPKYNGGYHHHTIVSAVGGPRAQRRANARLIAAAHDMRHALQTIANLSDDEIKARFGGHPSKSAEELAGKSAIYHLLVLPGNIAKSALAKAKAA